MALAYFITFSTYGTWLHGTSKGNGSVDRHHNAYGTPFLAPDDKLEKYAARRMADPPYTLSETARTVVRDAIVGLCAEKDWTLLALHVRTNHVHSVICAERDPRRLMSDLKSRASRDLNRAGTDSSAKRWTRHGSTRHLFDEASVAAAVAYTLDEQGSPMAVHDPRRQRAAHEEQRAAHEVSGQRKQGAAHEVSGQAVSTEIPTPPTSSPDETGEPLTSCAAHSPADTSGLNADENKEPRTK
jgi:REP element-mobilizing transposase RayT